MVEKTMLTQSEFEEGISTGLLLAGESKSDFRVEVAFEVYQMNPEKWHQVTEDNPAGNPIVAFILTDGPWWTIGEI